MMLLLQTLVLLGLQMVSSQDPPLKGDNFTVTSLPRLFTPPWYITNPTASEAMKYNIRKGQQQLIYMKVILEAEKQNSTYIAPFGIDVDSYAQLMVPNSKPFLV
jgi:hypothetical protein